MLGAIIGDIVGSIYEFNNCKSKDFDLFSSSNHFTDDTVLTIACMDYLINLKQNNPAKPEYFVKKWAKKYPYAGYGYSFRKWINEENSRPYNSCGNGSAMRISPVGFFAKSEEEVTQLVNNFTLITHNHPEGIKGALVTAMSIYYLRNGKSKEYVKNYVTEQYPVIKDLDYKDLVQNYKFEVLCQNSVPHAIYCFLLSDSFEDCLRTSVSIGGDTDTICAISGALADAYYGIPEQIVNNALKYLPNDMVQVYEKYTHTTKEV